MRVANASRALRRAALLLACTSAFAACSSNEPARKTIEMNIHYSKYSPDRIEVATGTTVDFVIANTDPIAHEFIIGTEAEQLEHEKGRADDPHTGPGEASIAAGQTVRLSFAFDKPGTLLYACHLPAHYAYGMKGTVTVT